jgi:hypothetical protein
MGGPHRRLVHLPVTPGIRLVDARHPTGQRLAAGARCGSSGTKPVSTVTPATRADFGTFVRE